MAAKKASKKSGVRQDNSAGESRKSGGVEAQSVKGRAKEEKAMPKKQQKGAQAKQKRSEKGERGKTPGFPVVGIGASAGGLEALEGFFANAPQQMETAYVVIQHRTAEKGGVMASLLKRFSHMEVVEVQDGEELRPNMVYLAPPHRELSIVKGKFCSTEPADERAARLPIDFFFRSLAVDRSERAICVILSGTGTDGTLGMRAVKAEGGLAIVQDTRQAKYDAMPRSALDTGLVDFELAVEQMGEEIGKFVNHPYIKGPVKESKAQDKFEAHLQQIFSIVRSQTGHDFAHYKRNTIRRRVERRMAVHQISDVGQYVRYLRENSGEVKTLFRDLIITVTHFFRDPEAFDALKDKVIDELVRSRDLNSPVRVWVAGCATGEEAYSVAILFVEKMAELNRRLNVQIFATDIDEETIGTARYGVYPESIAADVSKERLERFFTEQDSSYKISYQIREMVVFACQDLIKDPPFSRLDLVCCRNVMIYMGAELQKRVIPLFHYTLNSGGYLFLGTSETVGGFADLFGVVDTHDKLYRRKPGVIGREEYYPALTLDVARRAEAVQRGQHAPIDVGRLAERVILHDYSLPCVLVDEHYDVVYFNGDTRRFLSQPGGEPTLSIVKMVRAELQYQLTTLLHKVRREKKAERATGAEVREGDTYVKVDIVVRPVSQSRSEAEYLMVVFDVHEQEGKGGRREKKQGHQVQEGDPRVRALEQELASTKEYLQTTIEELETSNEELKSSNEELQSTNEELQSTNEELETSREELQSTNEELHTLNSAHQQKNEELTDANNDLSNLLASTEVATVFLDNRLNIKGFTPSVKSLFKLIDTDIGRPLSDLAGALKCEGLIGEAREVLRRLERTDHEVEGENGKWYQMRIMPYRTVENKIDGVVMTFQDITEIRRARDEARAAKAYAESIVETVRQPLLVLDKGLKVMTANKAFYNRFKVKPEETKGRVIYQLGDSQWDIPRLRELLEQVLPAKSSFEGFEVKHDFLRIGRRRMLVNARQIMEKEEGTEWILVAIEDMTEKG